MLKVGSDAFADNSRSLFWSSGWIALKERNKMFNSYFQISVKTLWNIGRAAVLESDTKVERCENFEGKFLTENFWYCSLPPEILFGFYFELPFSSASKDIWNRRDTTPQYQELLGSRLRIPIHICVKYKYNSRTPCLTGHHPDAKEEGYVPPDLDASSVLLTPGRSRKNEENLLLWKCAHLRLLSLSLGSRWQMSKHVSPPSETGFYRFSPTLHLHVAWCITPLV